MAASKETVEGMARVLLFELSPQQAYNIVERLCDEVKGNISYTRTMLALKELLCHKLEDKGNF